MLPLVKKFKSPSFLQTLEAGIRQVSLLFIRIDISFLIFYFYLGIIMSLHLYHQIQSRPSTSGAQDRSLCLLCAYENGSVVLREYDPKNKETSVEGVGWNIVWKSKHHVESSKKSMLSSSYISPLTVELFAVMAMRVSRSNDFALTISADNLICRYNLLVCQLYRKIP